MSMKTFLKNSSKSCVLDFFNAAGIEVNGSRHWDLSIKDDRFYDRVFRNHNLGLGESYMEGWWDSQSIDAMMHRILQLDLNKFIKSNLRFVSQAILNRLLNFQTIEKAKIVGERHYDIGNNLYELMLDKEMIYSCGYWQNAQTLDQAQINKLELTCQKLQLSPGMRLLDIGCGWGGFAKYAAKNYGVDVVGITISKEQKKLAEENCRNLPIEIRLQDYRELNEQFDRIVSIGMFEHVGYKNYSTYMHAAHRNLKDDGIFLLHTIGNNVSSTYGDHWISKYIFPNGMLPSITQIGRAIENLFVMEDWHNFGADYDKTLLAWHKNFNDNWTKIASEYSESFRRMWNYYLLSCAGAFRARNIQLWQIVLSKKGILGGFHREKIIIT